MLPSGTVLRFNLERSCSSRRSAPSHPSPGRQRPAVLREVLRAGSLQVCRCCPRDVMWRSKRTRGPADLTPGPTWPLRHPCSCPHPMKEPPAPLRLTGSWHCPHRPLVPLTPPYPAMVFISPGPRCAYLQQALGKMATLGDSQEPPRVPSPVNLASPGTPGTCQREAQLLHGHEHGTHPALHSLRLPAPSARPAPLALPAGNKAAHRVPGFLHPRTWVRPG